jgi:hypothetical protein
MRLAWNRKAAAFTRTELIVVLAVVFMVQLILFAVFGRFDQTRSRAPRISCVNHLKQIGTAYRIWSNDNGDRYPALQTVAKGGWSELLTNANQGFLCWTNYAIMSNELGQSTKILVCPSDERQPAADFSNFVSNGHLSYLVGATSDDTYPQSLLAGDRNLGLGTQPDRQYGLSPETGQGNDVAIATNSQAGPVCWSLKMHSAGNSAGAGNILLGDGSAQQVTSGSLRKNWQPHFNPTTNWPVGYAPSSPYLRVLFP